MKMKFRLIILLVVLVLSVPVNITDAATGNAGYAVYRDGVIGTGIWHAGLMNSPTSNDWYPVTHILGDSNGVIKHQWCCFIDNNVFKGVYRPNQAMTSYARDLVIATSQKLTEESISYNFLYQINYNLSGDPNWVYPGDIISLRCDGVVEYCYEWHGFKIYGGTYWDITRKGVKYFEEHASLSINPNTQAQNYMTLVQTTKP
ncbi:hypothetical protein BHU72_14690 [Desulfuribacillus stibiiarsenatis]|uniref:Uncharacterized protein n=1 Tax=Desulfuribacillus stibiiarsenatis TaxID=1390249 RepID=A0A1E5L7T3_9FIRM|nr:hypothetical protein [Desulfuribacillus stibiiarsenatis]OEH86074.1 hypothetical protein BHU72_14690 [Desulfuribacillus stibiiarsenatis]